MVDIATPQPHTDPDPPPRRTNWIPSRKAISGGFAGVLTFFIVAAANRYGYQIPVEMQVAIPAVITWLISYLVPASKQDIIRNLDNKIVALAVNDPASPVSVPAIAAEVRASTPDPGTTRLY